MDQLFISAGNRTVSLIQISTKFIGFKKASTISRGRKVIYMAAKSMSIRQVTTFDIPSGKYEVLAGGNGVAIGTIQEAQPKDVTIERHTLLIYNATYQETIREQITVFDPEADDYIPYDQYQTERNFKIYYNTQTKMLFSSAPSSITRKFLTHLEKNSPQDGSNQPDKPVVNGVYSIQFDFKSVADILQTTKVIRFGSEDEHVNTKTFSGDGVVQNDEANDAIANDEATQLIGIIRIGTKDYTISISKPGTLVVYSNIPRASDEKPFPLLEFTLQALMELKIIE